MRNPALATLLVAPILVLAACGSGDDDADDADQAVTETTTPVEETPVEEAPVEETPVEEEAEAGGPLLVIMDASGSMNKRLRGGGTRLEAAQDALRELVAGLPPEQEVGLRAFGNAPPKGEGCEVTELISPVAPLDPDGVDAAIDGLRAKGGTPIGLSLEQAAADLPDSDDRTIILVSDGKDSCAPPDPCDVASDLEEQGIDVLIETVGFALGGDNAARRQLKCIAEEGGGSFHDVSNADELAETLGEVSQGPSDWSGEWRTSYGRVTLTQSGNVVEGTYYNGAGKIQGTASGRTLSATWRESADFHGRLELKMTPGGNRFQGTWGSGESSDDNGSWTGSRAP